MHVHTSYVLLQSHFSWFKSASSHFKTCNIWGHLEFGASYLMAWSRKKKGLASTKDVPVGGSRGGRKARVVWAAPSWELSRGFRLMFFRADNKKKRKETQWTYRRGHKCRPVSEPGVLGMSANCETHIAFSELACRQVPNWQNPWCWWMTEQRNDVSTYFETAK